MMRYDVEQIRAALTELDGKLPRPTAVTIIGGGAVALILDDPDIVTKDIDAFCAPPWVLELARSLTIGIDPAAIADLPWNFEDRLSTVMRLPRLEIRVPERHDLVLSKLVPWRWSDEDHIRRLHAREPLDLETLLHRYETEMTHAIGDPRRLRWNVVLCVRMLFGEVLGARAEARLGTPG